MKICFITHAFPPGKLGGAEMYAQRIATALAKRGHEVIVITQAPYSGLSSLLPKVTARDGIKLYSFYPLNLFSIYRAQGKALLLKALWRIIDLLCIQTSLILLGILKKERPDVIHLHILHGFSPLFTLQLLRRKKIPTLMTIHTYGLFCMRCDYLKSGQRPCIRKHPCCQIFTKIVARLTNKFPHVVIAPSQFSLNIYRQNCIFNNTQWILMPNGTEDIPSSYTGKTLTHNDEFIILCAGRLEKNKGFQVVINTFRSLQHRNAKLIICGEGSYAKELKKQAADCDRIIFAGKLATPALREYYCKSALTVVPSLFCETFGQVVAESLSAGTPVVGSRIGALPELIQDDLNGYLFTPGDSRGLAEILDSLVRNPARINSMSIHALSSARRYEITAHINALEKIYAEATHLFPRN